MLLPRKTDEDDSSGMNKDAPEGKTWLDPTLLATLQVVEHHLEVIEERDQKLARLKALIQLYHFIQEQQLVIVANSGNVRRVMDLIGESFKDVNYKALDFSATE